MTTTNNTLPVSVGDSIVPPSGGRRYTCGIVEIIFLFAMSSVLFMIYGWAIINENNYTDNVIVCTGIMYNYVLGISIYSTILFLVSTVLLVIFLFGGNRGSPGNSFVVSLFQESWLIAFSLSLINLILFIDGVTVLSDEGICRTTRFFNFSVVYVVVAGLNLTFLKSLATL